MEGGSGSGNGSVGFLGSGAVEWTGLGCRVANGSRFDRWGARVAGWICVDVR